MFGSHSRPIAKYDAIDNRRRREKTKPEREPRIAEIELTLDRKRDRLVDDVEHQELPANVALHESAESITGFRRHAPLLEHFEIVRDFNRTEWAAKISAPEDKDRAERRRHPRTRIDIRLMSLFHPYPVLKAADLCIDIGSAKTLTSFAQVQQDERSKVGSRA